ncbi:hypothetical protein AOLI_G00016050 [Acnodon oligacanthus]
MDCRHWGLNHRPSDHRAGSLWGSTPVNEDRPDHQRFVPERDWNHRPSQQTRTSWQLHILSDPLRRVVFSQWKDGQKLLLIFQIAARVELDFLLFLKDESAVYQMGQFGWSTRSCSPGSHSGAFGRFFEL